MLDAVYVESPTSWTIVSLVADLLRGIVHLYYFHQFDKPVALNVAEEIAGARAAGPLSRVFPDEVRREATRRYQHFQARKSRCQVAGKAWLGLVLAGLVALLAVSPRRHRGWILWVPVVDVLGPIGLLTWRVAGRGGTPGTGGATLVEAAGDVVPTAVAFVTMLVCCEKTPDLPWG